MSNQTSRNPGSGGPGTPRRPGANGVPTEKRPSGNPANAVAPAPRPAAKPGPVRVAPSRISQPVTPQRQAFKIRPLDLALIGLGVLGVAVLAWVVLSSTNTGTGSGSTSADDPRQRIATRQPTPLVPNQVAPDFKLPATDGTVYSLSQFKGKVVLLELMAPWCPHCQADSPVLNAIYQAYKDKNVQVLGVNATPYGRNHESGDNSLITLADQQWFHDNFKLPFPLLFDKDVTVADAYGVVSFPTIYTIDARGVIVDEPDNPVSPDGISKSIDAALKQGASVPSDPVALAAPASGK